MYFAAFICSNPNSISIFCFVGMDKILQDKAIFRGVRDKVNSFFQVWLLQTSKQKMLSKFKIYSTPFFLKTHPQWNERVFPLAGMAAPADVTRAYGPCEIPWGSIDSPRKTLYIPALSFRIYQYTSNVKHQLMITSLFFYHEYSLK